MKKGFQTETELLELVKGKIILVWIANLSYVRVTKKDLMVALKHRKYVIGEVFTAEYTAAIEFYK